MSGRRYEPVDLGRLRTYSIGKRAHKMSKDDVARLPDVGASAAALIDSMPNMLGASAFRRAVSAVVAAHRADRPVAMAMGAHVVKVGCAPIVIDLMKRGVVRAIAGNNALAIHDAEVALFGQTSEEVADTIRDGSFGMVEETMNFFSEAASLAAERRAGFGETVGRLLIERDAPNAEFSLFAQAYKLGLPATVHVAFGTDTVHMAGGADGAAYGAATMHDFRAICAVVSDMGAKEGGSPGGVWMNVGSAVIMPEVFLKAVSVARNLGADLDNMTTINFDMIGHYRPHQNVVTRPVAKGNGHSVIGHHEILLPLFRQAVIEGLASEHG